MRLTLAAACVLALPMAASAAIKAEPPSELRPPRCELPAPPAGPDHRPWLLVGAGAVAVLAAALWPRRKPVAPPPDPFAVARRSLDAARMNGATAADVSAIVRRYAVDAFALPAPGLTSEEVITGLAGRRPFPAEVVNAAWAFLSECDVRIFAPVAPPASDLPERAEKLVADLEAARVAAARAL